MKNNHFSFSATALLCTALLAGCASNPRIGPSFRQISQMPVYEEKNTVTDEQAVATPKVEIIDVNDAVSLQLAHAETPQSLVDLDDRHDTNPDVVGLGDVVEVTLWESPPAVLFGGSMNSMGAGVAQTVKLPEQMVGEAGTISIPFLGNIVVQGKTPKQIQKRIVAGLHRKANQLQALVRVVQNHSSNATVIRAGKSVRIPLTAHRERVLDAVSAVGGTESSVQDISLQMTRGDQVRTVALEVVTADPKQNIVLRAGDVITMHANPLRFTALGAVTKNQQISFAARGMNLSEAMGAIGGLIDRRSDPRGIFIFRYQALSKLPLSEQRTWLDQGYKMHMTVPTIYRFDLNNPHSFFWMQRFAMHDKDVIYVANAPASEVQKFLQLIFSPVVSGISGIGNLSN